MSFGLEAGEILFVFFCRMIEYDLARQYTFEFFLRELKKSKKETENTSKAQLLNIESAL